MSLLKQLQQHGLDPARTVGVIVGVVFGLVYDRLRPPHVLYMPPWTDGTD